MNVKPVAPNAFTEVRPAIQIKPTKVSKEAATRVNQMTHISAWCGVTKGEKAPR